MKKLAIISDTHSYMDDAIIKHLNACDIIIHAGDIGNESVLEKIEQLGKENLLVHGNIDGGIVRKACPEYIITTVEGVKLLVIHIAGKPGWYYPQVQSLIREHQPAILICGHSHIVKVQYFEKLKLLHINPGACGKHGFHKVRTMITFEISGNKPANMNLIELGNR
jgi:uncharacterized protein